MQLWSLSLLLVYFCHFCHTCHSTMTGKKYKYRAFLNFSTPENTAPLLTLPKAQMKLLHLEEIIDYDAQ